MSKTTARSKAHDLVSKFGAKAPKVCSEILLVGLLPNQRRYWMEVRLECKSVTSPLLDKQHLMDSHPELISYSAKNLLKFCNDHKITMKLGYDMNKKFLYSEWKKKYYTRKKNVNETIEQVL